MNEQIREFITRMFTKHGGNPVFSDTENVIYLNVGLNEGYVQDIFTQSGLKKFEIGTQYEYDPEQNGWKYTRVARY